MSSNRTFFNLTASGYDLLTHQALWSAQVERLIDALGESDDLSRVRHVLDVGCGPGQSAFGLARRLPHAQILGVDVADRMIARARQHHRGRYSALKNLRFERADVYALPADLPPFDLIVGHSFLYLLPDRKGALSALGAALGPGGRLALLEPNADASLPHATAGALTNPDARQHALRHPVSTGRFALSMVGWRLASRSRAPMRQSTLRTLLQGAGLVDISVRPTLGDLGLMAIARRKG
ncbi:class I SAM-dependent methyltransferase [Lujinxingia vulgaris]|uniref:Class I SAM-dependent methyltransferase n=1 Tax=Lujinxingia vulgaris TaxID=2600176 RepID=A0A5C6X5Y4_9DELT|nr:class I SAM-dependent methyltransferase [Lujinxingia vulgaris]TXD36580.1 class I SAM-dependent methyltransferase [Lujinxingia vulgaris]